MNVLVIKKKKFERFGERAFTDALWLHAAQKQNLFDLRRGKFIEKRTKKILMPMRSDDFVTLNTISSKKLKIS